MEMEQQNRYRKDQNQKNELQRRLEQEKKLERNVDGHEKALEEEKKKTTKESTIGKFPKCVISKFDKTALDQFRFWKQFATEKELSDGIFYYPMSAS